MQEILTPVQYESALDVLNRINKLYVDKYASLSIDAMQACKNPVGDGQPIIGKFCKGDNQGAIACHAPVVGLDNYEYAYYDVGVTVECMEHVFAQRVSGILIRVFILRPLDYTVRWVMPDGSVIKTFPHNVWEWLTFEGDTIKICGSIIGASFRVWMYGFY